MPRARYVTSEPHLLEERDGSERLLNESHLRLENAMMNDGVIGVAGHEQQRHVGSDDGQTLCELTSPHEWHHDVSEKKVHVTRMPLGDEERVHPVGGFEHVVPLPAE